MAISVTCECGKSFLAKSEAGATKVNCPACGRGCPVAAKSRVCRFCGAKLSGGSRKCPECGKERKRKRSGFPVLRVLLGVVLVVGVAAVGFLVFSSGMLNRLGIDRGKQKPFGLDDMHEGKPVRQWIDDFNPYKGFDLRKMVPSEGEDFRVWRKARDEKLQVRRKARVQLAKMGSRVVPALAEAVAVEDPNTREDLAFSLVAPGHFGSADRELRKLGAEAPGGLHKDEETEAADLRLRKFATDALSELLKHQEPDVRYAAAFALTDRINREWLQAITKTAVDRTTLLAVLIEALRDKEVSARKKAVSRLYIFGPEAKSAVPALLEAARNQDTALRPAAAAALEKIDGEAFDLLNKNRTFRGHSESVTSVTFSPDGQRIISASWDKTIKIWDAGNGQVLFTLVGHTSLIASVAMSPDGKRLVSGSTESRHTSINLSEVKVWDADTGQVKLTLKAHSAGVTGVAFSPDSKRFVTGGLGGATVWDSYTGRAVVSFQTNWDRVTSVAFSPDGNRVAAGMNNATVKIWDVGTGQEIVTHNRRGSVLGFSPDGKHIRSAGSGNISVWDAQTGQDVLKLDTGKVFRDLFCAAFSADGKRIVASGHDLQHVASSPDGKRFAAHGENSSIRVWDAQTGQPILTLGGYASPVHCVAFSPDGKRLVSGHYRGIIKLWDP